MLLIWFVLLISSSSVVPTKLSATFARSIQSASHGAQYNHSSASEDPVQSQLLLTTPEIIVKHDYPVEQHTVETSDGYILTHFRIPHGHDGLREKRGPPVIVQHGILAASDTWILMGREKSLGFILADAGYDVWLTNIRGNRHARKHISLSTNSKKFWDFSWHEMGYYDMPATIDYILDITKETQVYYIGHSMGTTMLFVMASLRPEYNDKIRLGMALAPIAYLRNNRHQLLNTILPSSRRIARFLDSNKVWDILPYDKSMASLLGTLCRKGSPAHGLCVFGYNMAFGEDTVQLNKTLLPLFMAHLLAGTSVKTVLHYSQVIKSGEFRRFDHGLQRNMELYRQNTPPQYEIEKATAPIALFYGTGDPLTSMESIELLKKRLPNIVSCNRVPHDKFNHIDFILANDGKSLLFKNLLQLMEEY